MTNTDDTALRLERLIPSPPEVLFALWIDPAELVKWWAPDGYAAMVDTLDVRPGGRWRTRLRRADGFMIAASGMFRVVEPPRNLAFTWAWEDAASKRGHETEVSVTFEAAPGGTRLVLQQQRFEDKVACDRHAIGWSESIARMARIAS